MHVVLYLFIIYTFYLSFACVKKSIIMASKDSGEKPVDDKSIADISRMFEQMGARPKGESLQQLRDQMMAFLKVTGGFGLSDPPHRRGDAAHGGHGGDVPQPQGNTAMDARFYKLPVFAGDVGKGETTFDLWRYDVQCLPDAGKSMDLIGQSIRRSLKGTATRVAMTSGPSVSPEQLISKLRSLYGIVDDQETLLEHLYAAHQNPQESVTDWECRLEDLLNRADGAINPAERNRRLHNQFWTGLRQELRCFGTQV